MKIEVQNLVHTPENMEELETWIESHPKKDKAQIWIGVLMAWNLAAKITNTEEEDNENNTHN